MEGSVPIFKHKLEPLGLDVPPAGECSFEEIVCRKTIAQKNGNRNYCTNFSIYRELLCILRAYEAEEKVWLTW